MFCEKYVKGKGEVHTKIKNLSPFIHPCLLKPVFDSLFCGTLCVHTIKIQSQRFRMTCG